MPIYEDNTRSIGHTPLVRINRLGAGSGARILAKIEGRNPAYSVKCRIGSAMVWDAEERGALKPGMAIVEATSGNTGMHSPSRPHRAATIASSPCRRR